MHFFFVLVVLVRFPFSLLFFFFERKRRGHEVGWRREGTVSRGSWEKGKNMSKMYEKFKKINKQCEDDKKWVWAWSVYHFLSPSLLLHFLTAMDEFTKIPFLDSGLESWFSQLPESWTKFQFFRPGVLCDSSTSDPIQQAWREAHRRLSMIWFSII